VIPQAHITAWRATAPWSEDAQVEQDLVLSRAVVELFADPETSTQLALRGGTALNKLFVAPGMRYSEDIDLVQNRPGPAGPLIDTIRARIDPWLGKPKRGRAEGGISLVYRFPSEIPPVRPLRLKIEINTREHFTVFGLETRSLAVASPWFTSTVDVVTYRLDELMGTKLRALFQRRKGRDLFDLWLCLERKLVRPDQVVRCFLRYMNHEGHSVSRAQFEQNLHEKESDRDFMDDMMPLLRPSLRYDAVAAISLVRAELIGLLPGAPWRGAGD